MLAVTSENLQGLKAAVRNGLKGEVQMQAMA